MAIQKPHRTSQITFRIVLSMPVPRWTHCALSRLSFFLPYLKLAEQHLGGAGHVLDGLLERLSVVLGRPLEPADLLDILARCGPDVLVGDVLGVRRAQGLDAAAHACEGTPPPPQLPRRQPPRTAGQARLSS